ncbi:MAG TPA: DMT family transporter [Bacillota bacterium]|nr:DMT family transporter [Bacillota bacterium]HOL10724.1 DMT family transporter [Bacillota bacterium]HPO98400.1 DMT family transporter [Bacillota bacterium]
MILERDNNNLQGHLLAIVTIVIWGTTFIATKVLLRQLTPTEILVYRFIIAYLALWIIYPKFVGVKRFRDELLFFSLGLTGITFYFLAEIIALQYTLAANVGLIIAAAPILTALLANLFTHDEKFNRNLLVGFLLAIVGSFLVIFNGRFVLKLSPVGDLLAVTAALAWAIYSILLKKINSKGNSAYNPILVVRRTFIYGLVTLIPSLLLLRIGFKPVNLTSWSLLLNILFLGVIASALGFVMWNKAVKTLGVIKSNNYIYLVPLVTMVTSVLILKEPVNLWMFIGGLLILGGVYISENGLKFTWT